MMVLNMFSGLGRVPLSEQECSREYKTPPENRKPSNAEIRARVELAEANATEAVRVSREQGVTIDEALKIIKQNGSV